MKKNNSVPRPTLYEQSALKIVLFTFSALCASTAHPALAAGAGISPTEIDALRQELREMRQQQQAANARINEIESALDQITGQPTVARISSDAPAPAASTLAVASTAPQTATPAPTAQGLSRLDVSGDLRLRYEGNFSDAAPTRNRGVIRARIRADYHLNDWLKIGGRIGTGDQNDPNSDDVTLSNFADDLSVSLDQAYAAFSFGDAVVYGGKIPLPFKRTDLVWDGDVNPQGASVNYTSELGGAKVELAGLYFLIDEDVAGQDSDMAGAQISFSTTSDSGFSFAAAAAYFDYSISSIGGADAGDFRSNLLAMDGSYLSDFDLLNVNGAVTYNGFGQRWPVALSADFVKNYGSVTDEDTGYSFNISTGRAKMKNDWRLGYGYMHAEVDSVFAAFSHDNLALATNYELHALSADYVIDDHLSLNATYYHYRPLESISLSITDPGAWLNRLRLNAIVTF